jgi:hypothetical protein
MNDGKNIRDQVFGMSSGARECLQQLFLNGPTWDGDLASKNGRSELYKQGFVFIWNGWQSLTEAGMKFAVDVMLLDQVKEKRDRERRRA